ncbi:MAG: hypothetical protein IKG32_04750 [Clostridia bacterium]|nr:hypothetical protein [Clostridia bacterium]
MYGDVATIIAQIKKKHAYQSPYLLVFLTLTTVSQMILAYISKVNPNPAHDNQNRRRCGGFTTE